MTYADIEIICLECDRPFTYSSRDQEFFLEHDLSTPRRCRACRAERRRCRAERELQQASRA